MSPVQQAVLSSTDPCSSSCCEESLHCFSNAMTQLPHDDFETSLEMAETWMKEIHKRLKENDNTQGPRSALESRLRETEKICSLEGDGKLLVEKVLMKAEVLLGDSSEEEKHEIQLKLAKIKGSLEETTTYMIHCHSRIEWVWLHWNEYLRALDEFTLWVHNVSLTLEPDVELQLGLKEKRWQYEQALVLMKDILNQSRLVDRLLEEASSLYNRIGDPSVEESVQNAMMAEYIKIKKKAQERVERLEKIWKDHEAYEGDVSGFKTWLNSVIEKLKVYVAAASDGTENRLDILQEISKDVESGNKQLQALEEKSAEVIKNTSPLGAEKICRELEELRKTLKELKQMNDEEEETLLKTHNMDNTFLLLAQQLEANINEFRKATQRLEESLESGERVKSEDELIALWKTLNATKSALAAEEAKAERVKVQLKDLFKFSKDVQPLSDGVISAMRDYQRAKSKAFKLSTDTESELKQLFQNPLREFLYWKPIAESVLDATAVPVNDGAMNRDALDNIEKLLGESCAIQDKLAALEKKKERIHLVLGDQKTQTLLQDIAAAQQNREALHRDLLERKKSLQSLAELRKEFDSALKTLHHKISAIRKKSLKENELQPDIIGKEAQVQRLQILLEELMILHTPIQELISMTKSHSPHALRAEQLNSDYLRLQRSLENKIRSSKENINNHRLFSHNLRDLQHWIMVTRQKLEFYQNGGKNWGEQDTESLNAELSEKEILRHLVETQGLTVMDSSSPEGAARIQQEIKQLIDSWKSLQLLYEQMSSVEDKEQQKSRLKSVQRPPAVTGCQTSSISQDGQVVHMNSSDAFGTSGSPRKDGFRQIWGLSGISQDEQVIHMDLPDDVSGSPRKEEFLQIGGMSCQDEQVTHMDSLDDASGSPRKEGFQQIWGSSGISQDRQVIHMNSLDDISGSLKTEGFLQIRGLSGEDEQVIHMDSPDDVSNSQRKEGFLQIGGSSSQVEQVIQMDSPDDVITSGSTRKEGSRQIWGPSCKDGQIIHKDSLDEISTKLSTKKEGFQQVGDLSRIGQGGRVKHVNSLDDIRTGGFRRKEGFQQVGDSSGSQDGQVIHIDSPGDFHTRGSSRKERIREIRVPSSQDEQVIHKNSLDDLSIYSSRKEGFRQIGGLSGISQDEQAILSNSPNDVNTSSTPRKEGIGQSGGSYRISQDRQVIHRDSPNDINTSATSRKEGIGQIGGSYRISQDGQVIHRDSPNDINTSATSRKEGIGQIGGSYRISQDGQVIHRDSPNDINTSATSRKEGIGQIGGSYRISQDRQVIHRDSPNDVNTSATPRKEGIGQIGGSSRIGQDRQVIQKDSLHDISIEESPRKGGFRQIGSSSISQDGQAIHMNLPDDISTNTSPRKEGFQQIGGSSSISQDRQSLYTNSLDDVSTTRSPRKEGFQRIGGSSGSSYNVMMNSNTDPARGPRYNKGARHKEHTHSTNVVSISTEEKTDVDRPEIQENNGSYRVSGNGSNSPRRSNKQRDKRTSGASSYEFRVIDQKDDKSVAPGSGDEEVRGLGAQGHLRWSSRINGDSDRDLRLTQGTSPSHPPVKSHRSPAAVEGLTFRTGQHQDEERWQRSGAEISPGHLQITSSFIAEGNMKKKEKFPNNPGASRRNQKFVSLAESVDLVDSPSTEGMGRKAGDNHKKLLLEFELWLQGESSKLNRICAAPVSDTNGIKTWQSQLQNLQLRVPQGQNLFESLLRSRSSMAVTEELKMEELRYLWMLYKSKLRDSGKHAIMKVADEPRGITKAPGGLCSFLHRVCCAALPLQLLLLLLLLLAFLLPFLHEAKTCALSNNFARSFNLMLKYDGPPPT
ncbi:nesprin-3 isoform X2 [Dendrobates tinctorius]|uniref:nesprin-3 isoform X2 n=1 Tax=Dendrobates tinctorius TaxID=92724 RepID=UPI003CC948A5